MTGDQRSILAGDRPRALDRLIDSSDLVDRGVDLHRQGITDGSESLTFGEYADAVARLAGGLVGLGVKPGDRVAVHLRKSVWSFVTVHAVLRAGGVMVPLDPLAPPAHVAGVLVDADASVLVTDAPPARLHEMLTGVGLGAIVSLRAVEWPAGSVMAWDDAIAHEPVDRVGVAGTDPAYIIYTSGSTGRPKGIVHTHSSAWAYAERAVTEYGLGHSDRLANVASLHFDQSTFELYSAPLAGAATIVVPDAVLRFPASLSELIERERATVWYSVPYILRQLSTRGALDERDLTALRWVLFGGEIYPPGELATLMRQLPDATFSNVYGPAEVNQCAAYHLSTPPPPDRTVPIGRAWAGTELVVVDDRLQPVPSGDIGELLVATPTMMSGYWARPELTAASVIELDGRDWYRTGDLVYADEAGDLVFLGRVDHQVKVRGQRVELEAVEAALLDLDEIAEVGVVADASGDEVALAAAVIPRAGTEPGSTFDARSISRSLAARLPAAAIPGSIVEVEWLPRTASGKIDRPALVERLAGNSTDTPN